MAGVLITVIESPSKTTLGLLTPGLLLLAKRTIATARSHVTVCGAYSLRAFMPTRNGGLQDEVLVGLRVLHVLRNMCPLLLGRLVCSQQEWSQGEADEDTAGGDVERQLVAERQGVDQLVATGDEGPRPVRRDRAQHGQAHRRRHLLGHVDDARAQPGSGMNEAPAPTPSMRNARKIFGKYSAFWPAAASRTRPPAARSMAGYITRLP